MLTAVQFNYNPLFKADEINDKVLDWLLSSKFYALKSLGSKISPENAFGKGRILAQVLRKFRKRILATGYATLPIAADVEQGGCS